MERNWKREYRRRVAMNKTTDSDDEHNLCGDPDLTPRKVYSSRQAAGKAMQRLRVKLPFCPQKRKAVTLKLALEAGNKLEKPKRNREGVGKETEMKIVSFYSRDDISWAAPGMKDSQVVKSSNGVKDVQQKRFLTMNIMEAFQLFKAENRDVDVGKSKFFTLRPQHIQLMANIPHNVCICKQHGNIDSLLQGIGKEYPECPSTGRALTDSLVCQRENPSCMLNTCEKCSQSYAV